MQGSSADVEGEKDPTEPVAVELSDSWYQECFFEKVNACSRCRFGATDGFESKIFGLILCYIVTFVTTVSSKPSDLANRREHLSKERSTCSHTRDFPVLYTDWQVLFRMWLAHCVVCCHTFVWRVLHLCLDVKSCICKYVKRKLWKNSFLQWTSKDRERLKTKKKSLCVVETYRERKRT